MYDTVRYLGWSVGVLSHRMTQVLSELLSEDWDMRVLRGRSVPSSVAATLGAVPEAQHETDCVDCAGWTLSA